MPKWKQLSIDEAQQHPLYGVKGWLLVILILMALDAIGTFYRWSYAYSRLEIVYGSTTLVSAILSIVVGLIYAGIAYFGFIKDYRLPNYVITMLWISFGIGVLNTFIVKMGISSDTASIAIAMWTLVSSPVVSLLLIWYFTVSKRVSVTYFHREPVNG